MEKMILNDNTNLEIMEGAKLGAVTIIVADWTVLGEVAEKLLAEGNLDKVLFQFGENVTGEYENMKLESPLFHSVDVVGGEIQATIAIRQKTEMELAIEELQKGQDVQDGAIADLGEAVSAMAEGGEV